MKPGVRDVLIRQLADGRVHSGAALARRLGRSRTAVWKHLRGLGPLGLDVEALPGRGYRLAAPLELLDREMIRSGLELAAAAALESCELHSVIESTNDHLRAMAPPSPGRFRLALAEFQAGGRGRQGRAWLSPFGSGVCMSASWQFETAPACLPALGLAAGLGICRALEADGLRLKWPNDIVWQDRKLAGVLIDVVGESTGPLKVVIGAGINLHVPAGLEAGVTADGGLPPAGLDQLPGGRAGRNEIAARAASGLHAVLAEFTGSGFEPFAAEWRRLDCLRGRPVRLRAGSELIDGIAAGIGDDGALLLETPGGLRPVLAGEVTLRAD